MNGIPLSPTHHDGFTLIEMVIVITIVAIISAALILAWPKQHLIYSSYACKVSYQINIGDMLKELADAYEAEVDYDLGRLGDLIEPVLLCILGLWFCSSCLAYSYHCVV